ncbi:MAG: putative DNA binding domain-containing protein [Longicatena sp.]
MFDLKELSSIKEKDIFEGKKAKRELPNAIWETYSSFANSSGGTIVLGIEELKNGCFQICGVEQSDKIVKDFWNTINNKKKVNLNILCNQDVRIETIENKTIIIIEIPRAAREQKPIYLNNDLFGGTYRRNGEGDYHCSIIEIKNMLRDQPERTNDFKIVEQFDISVLDKETIRSYRNLFSVNKPGHTWNTLEDSEFLYRISAIEKTHEKTFRPTIAGLLMFGYDYDIERIFPNYFLDYQEKFDNLTRWTSRLHSDQGDWTGNLFDYFFRVYQYFSASIKTPFLLENNLYRKDDSNLHIALREALLNCIGNADFYNSKGILINYTPSGIRFENPGAMRISIQKAIEGGTSDARNKAIMKMFGLIGLGEKAGSGVPDIFAICNDLNLPKPYLHEEYNPDRTYLEIYIRRGNMHLLERQSLLISNQEKLVMTYVEDKGSCICKEIEDLLHIKGTRARVILSQMVKKDLLIARGANRNRTYICNHNL